MSSTPSSSSSSTSSSSTENDLGTSERRSSQVGTSTHRSQVGTSTPQVSTSFSRRDALGEIKDEAKDKFDEDTWFSADEKRNKMTKDSIVELLEEIPLPHPFSARVHALQEPANYGTNLETSVYEGQIRSGYRVPMHPFAVAFSNHYKMAPGQLVPNGWRKLVGLIYLVQTSWYPVTVDDFMRLYLEIKRHAGLIPPALAVHVLPIPVVESQLVLGPKTQGLAIGTSSSRTPSLEMAGKGVDPKGDFLGLLQKASKGKRKEDSSPLVKRASAPTPLVPPLVVEDLPVEKDPIFCPRWTIKRGDSRMPSSHVFDQHLAHRVLPSDKLILENQPHEAFAMAHVQAAYNAYCYSSQMQDRFAMAMDIARIAETDKRAAEGKTDKLDKEVKNLKAKNAELLTKLGSLEKRCEKLRHEKVEVGNKAIQAFLDGTAGEEWLQKRTEYELSIFQEGFEKAKELTMAKYPSLFLDDIVVPTFESPSGETAAPPEAGDAISPGNAPPILGPFICIPLFSSFSASTNCNTRTVGRPTSTGSSSSVPKHSKNGVSPITEWGVVRLGMSDRCKTETNRETFTKASKVRIIELIPIIGDQDLWNSKAADNVLPEKLFAF
ncbi:hypothetical protein RJ639_001574 [Escallonia herrerae]|uniref:Transposase (putative) gypsy type domain-containing protein n=1 Tax=Escallonia herrerae TaxID=1293975 RepID=A0AA88X7C2_9ASTE|nr:hypothetical protein RJ639_001574 [Escallonia herrerae]